jgi:ubiquinol-cytochrome c reductase cytochrome b subunit
MSRLLDWLDDRTGYRKVLHEALYERVPGGARWRYVWGSTLVFAFTVQLITGLVLWMAYAPSNSTAWESVYYIQHHMAGGWLLRGIHHFMAQAMVVLLALHLLQVVWDGAYRAPREVNFWLGLILMLIVLGLSLTGYLLPWDQKGYWATKVATNIMGIAPVIGDATQKLVVAGDDYGHATVTRFFALHAGLLPGLLVLFLVLHLAVFRRHGLHARRRGGRPDALFWPDQVLRDAVACLAVLAVVLGLTLYYGGADLSAPADGAREYSAARPEWYFLFLFQFLKLFEGMGHIGELLGAIIIPGGIVLYLFLMPLVGRAALGHVLNVTVVLLLLGGAGLLTYLALQQDHGSRDYQNARWAAHLDSRVAVELAAGGIPPDGAQRMMRTHPRAVALRAFTDQCLKCHTYVDTSGTGHDTDKPSAPNLYHLGRAEWIEALLDPQKLASKHFAGINGGDMASFVKDDMASAMDDDGKPLYDAQGIRAVAAALAAEGGFPHDAALVEDGRRRIADGNGCAGCHEFHGQGAGFGAAPDLTGWGSRDWLIGMIRNPNHERFYSHLGEEQIMPAYGLDPQEPKAHQLSDETIGYIADFLRGAWLSDEPPPGAPPQQPAADEQTAAR